MTVKSTANGSTKKPSRFAAADASRAQSSDRLISAISSAAGTASSGGSTRAASPRTKRHTSAPAEAASAVYSGSKRPSAPASGRPMKNRLLVLKSKGSRSGASATMTMRHRPCEADEAGGESRERHCAEHERDAAARRGEPIERARREGAGEQRLGDGDRDQTAGDDGARAAEQASERADRPDDRRDVGARHVG